MPKSLVLFWLIRPKKNDSISLQSEILTLTSGASQHYYTLPRHPTMPRHPIMPSSLHQSMDLPQPTFQIFVLICCLPHGSGGPVPLRPNHRQTQVVPDVAPGLGRDRTMQPQMI